jgi:ankyrin repeat protein
MVKMLLAKRANVNSRSKSGLTPLMPAASERESETVLLEKGADVNACDDAGRKPLMHAAANGRLANARALLSEGADVR